MQPNRYTPGPVATFIAGILSLVAVGFLIAALMSFSENPTSGALYFVAFLAIGATGIKIGGGKVVDQGVHLNGQSR